MRSFRPGDRCSRPALESRFGHRRGAGCPHFSPLKAKYANNLKNWNFDKEATQNFCLERATIAARQGASEDRNSELKPTPSKTDSSSYLRIKFAFTSLQKKTSVLADRGFVFET